MRYLSLGLIVFNLACANKPVPETSSEKPCSTQSSGYVANEKSITFESTLCSGQKTQSIMTLTEAQGTASVITYNSTNPLGVYSGVRTECTFPSYANPLELSCDDGSHKTVYIK